MCAQPHVHPCVGGSLAAVAWVNVATDIAGAYAQISAGSNHDVRVVLAYAAGLVKRLFGCAGDVCIASDVSEDDPGLRLHISVGPDL